MKFLMIFSIFSLRFGTISPEQLSPPLILIKRQAVPPSFAGGSPGSASGVLPGASSQSQSLSNAGTTGTNFGTNFGGSAPTNANIGGQPGSGISNQPIPGLQLINSVTGMMKNLAKSPIQSLLKGPTPHPIMGQG